MSCVQNLLAKTDKKTRQAIVREKKKEKERRA